jgi:EAL domain-containing protein (putative c-di-GMP-specific phosphodiesterase class I)
MIAFVVVGIFVAYLMRGRKEPLRAAMHDSRVSARLIQAVRRHEVDVHYQPIYRLEDMRIAGFEALARWADPERGLVMPGDFVPAAERSGAITILDAHVLSLAAAQVERWRAEFTPLKVSINVSATRFGRPHLGREVARVLDDSGLPAQALQLEITESALIDDISSAARQVDELRGLGVRIAIDDFGTGRAALAYLDHFEVDTIKLDRGFLVRATTNHRARRLLTGIARALRELGVDVVAEGIETEEQLLLSRQIGITHGQGFHLGRPVPAEQAARLLAT